MGARPGMTIEFLLDRTLDELHEMVKIANANNRKK